MDPICFSTDTFVPRVRENTVSSDEKRRARIQTALLGAAFGAAEVSPTKLPSRLKKEEKGSLRLTSKRRISNGPPVKNFFAKLFRGSSSSQKSGAAWKSAAPSPQVSRRSSIGSGRISVVDPEEVRATIGALYQEFAMLVAKSTLSLSEKMTRIATYIGGLRVIIAANVCHGDLKPDNILWDETRFAISDFNGSISITDVCEMMREEFCFESEDQKSAIKRIVYSLCDGNLPKVSGNQGAIKKLIEWGILAENALHNFTKKSIKNKYKLDELKHYLATKFIPQNTKGYACTLYFDKMCSSFWRCEKEQFRLACFAFDMRAAALTMYAILTGSYPPLLERDTQYYQSLEASLNELGVSARASSIIRKMAEPKDSTPFTLPVTLDELEELQNEFCPENRCEHDRKLEHLQEDVEKLEIGEGLPPPATEVEELEQRLKLLQLTIHNLTGLAEVDEKGQLESFKGDLVATLENDKQLDKPTREMLVKNAQALQESQNSGMSEMEEMAFSIKHYKAEVEAFTRAMNRLIDARQENPEQEMDLIHRQALIEKAFKAYPDACQVTSGSDVTVLLMDPDELDSCDVLVRQEAIGDGASATAYKALSLRELRYVVLKDFQDGVVPQEVQNGGKILSEIGEHMGVQEKVKIYSLGAKEEYKQVFLEPYYKNRDYAPAIYADLFCSRWNIPKESEAVLRVLRESFPVPSSMGQLEAFIDEYGRIFTGILGMHKVKKLVENYQALIAEDVKLKEQEVANRSLRLKQHHGISELLQSGAQRQERIKNEAHYLIDSCKYSQGGLITIDLDELKRLLASCDKSYHSAIKEVAKAVMVVAIRRCQRNIVQEWLVKAERRNDNPIYLAREWEKRVFDMEVGDSYLDLNGIKSLCKLLGIKIAAQEGQNSKNQQMLMTLCKILEQISELSLMSKRLQGLVKDK